MNDAPITDLRVTLIQTSIYPKNPQKNIHHLNLLLQSVPKTDLILLPEVFTTGFCAAAREAAEVRDGFAYQWMLKKANELNAVVAGSLVVKEGDCYFNRLVWAQPDGRYSEYNKRHLFRMAGEHLRYSAGDNRLLVSLKSWRILPLVCYDLRFPVWCRNRNDYDLAFYLANWPSQRALHWNRLLQARAIENLSYVVGVNRVGEDEAGQIYQGDSSVYSPKGDCDFISQTAGVFTQVLSHELLTDYRKKFPAHMDADEFDIR
jgi:omega-amidase